MFIMIKSLETLGNLLSRDVVDSIGDELTPQQVLQWLNVVHAVANNSNIEQAVCDLDVKPFGSNIVRLVGSLRNQKLVQCVGAKVEWNTIVHNQNYETTANSQYHKYSYRHRLLKNLTEQNFWTREFGSNRFEEDAFDNTAFVFHTSLEHGSMSFNHPVASVLFGHPVPFGTAVLAHQLGETYYIFEDTPFANIAIEHHSDFFVAGCLHMGAREEHLDPEDRTLGEGRLKQLIATLSGMDANTVYQPSNYLCEAVGWPEGTRCPLGVVGLAVLASSPIDSPSTVLFAKHILASLTVENKELSLHFMLDALINTTSWNTRMGQSDFGPINSLIVSDFISHSPNAARTFILNTFEQFDRTPSAQKDVVRDFLATASSTSSALFSLDDAPKFLFGVFRVFDVRSATGSTWSAQTRWKNWWHSAFTDSLQWFDPDSSQKIQEFMQPYLLAMAGVAISSKDQEQRMQSTIMLETFDPCTLGRDQPRKLKI